ncbi:MAG: hypothetical protein WA843_00055 [Candidatus Saccharimonadales bacterium]
MIDGLNVRDCLFLGTTHSDQLVYQRERCRVRPIIVVPDRTGSICASEVKPETTVAETVLPTHHPAQQQGPLTAPIIDPLVTATLTRLLDLRLCLTVNYLRRVAIQVLSAFVVDAVVVGAHEAGNDWTDAGRTVSERLASKHRGELHDTDSLIGRGVLAFAQANRLVRYGHCSNPFCGPTVLAQPASILGKMRREIFLLMLYDIDSHLYVRCMYIIL